MLEGGHSLRNWGEKLYKKKYEFDQFDYFSEEMLQYDYQNI